MRRLLLLMFLALFTMSLYAQQKKITGKVTDEKGMGLAGATVSIVGAKGKTATAADGSFTIAVLPKTKSLLITFVGFNDQVVDISGNDVTVKMEPAAKVEEEVVVTGINSTKKKRFAGAASKIGADEIKNQPTGSFDQILQGKAPGVLVMSGSGAPGEASTVIIRGSNSIEGGSVPLYVIDGIPVEAEVFQGLNPNDFASIDVLKDASSLALYGSRGSAGVIVITTKRGSTGKVRLSYSGQAGVKMQPSFNYTMMNTDQLFKAQQKYGMVMYSSGNPVDTASARLNIPGFYYSKNNPDYITLNSTERSYRDRVYDSLSKINTNWNDAFLRNGTFSNHEISLSGGTGKTRFYSSLGLYNEVGTTLRTDMNRVTFRNNVDYTDDKFTMSFSSTFGYTRRNFQQSTTGNSLSNPFLVSSVAVPYQNEYNSDGTYAVGNGAQYAATNTLDLTKYDVRSSDQIKATLSTTLGYKITSYLNIGLTTGIDFRESQAESYGSQLAYIRYSSTSIQGKAGFQTESLIRNMNADFRPSINFNKIFNKKHDVDFTAYAEYIEGPYKGISVTGYGTDPKRPNSPVAITQGDGNNQLYAVADGQSTDGKQKTALFSGLIIGKYTYDNKYTFNASYRYDGASEMPLASRWVSFYSIGGVWDMTKENFLKGNRNVNSLRLKASYGGVGDENNFPGGAYPYQAQYSQGTYSGINTVGPITPGSPTLKWETSWTTNFGIDFELFRGKLYGDINLYNKLTKDLFLPKPLSLAAAAPFSSQDVNAGEMRNKGIEWNVNFDVVRKRGFLVSLFTNGAYNQNRVTNLGGLPSFEQGTSRVTIGLPIGSNIDVKWAGVDAATGSPLYYDINGKLINTYRSSDRVQQFGTWEAPWKGGFGFKIRYHDLELSTLFTWQSGAIKSNNLEYFMENPTGFLATGYNQATSLNFWTKPGDLATTPSPLYPVTFSSKLFHDASFTRFRELRLAYSLNQKVLDKMKVFSRFSIYAQANNLYIWTNWKGMDPEAGATNINLAEFPNPKAYTVGLDVTF